MSTTPPSVEVLARVLQRVLLCASGPWGLRRESAQILLSELEEEFFPEAEEERRREHNEILQRIRKELSR